MRLKVPYRPVPLAFGRLASLIVNTRDVAESDERDIYNRGMAHKYIQMDPTHTAEAKQRELLVLQHMHP